MNCNYYNVIKRLSLVTILLMLTGCATVTYKPPRIPETMGGVYHQVGSGETLWRIAQAYKVDIQELVRLNRLPDASRINVGQLVFIPDARQRIDTQQLYDERDNFVWPVKGKVLSHFGSLTGGVKNKGIDIQTREGTSIVAARSGRVSFCDDKVKGFGKTVIIDHGDGFSSVYAYNAAILVTVGTYVRQGGPIAKAGKSGRAQTASLHFEIRKHHEPQNPFYYLP